MFVLAHLQTCYYAMQPSAGRCKDSAPYLIFTKQLYGINIIKNPPQPVCWPLCLFLSGT